MIDQVAGLSAGSDAWKNYKNTKIGIDKGDISAFMDRAGEFRSGKTELSRADMDSNYNVAALSSDLFRHRSRTVSNEMATIFNAVKAVLINDDHMQTYDADGNGSLSANEILDIFAQAGTLKA